MFASPTATLISLLLFVALVVTLFVFFAAPAPYDAHASSSPNSGATSAARATTSVQIVVLGDIGRSPRMQNHALSLARYGARVHLIGFVESDVHPDLRDSSFVTIVPLSPAPEFLQTRSRVLFPVLAPFKVMWQVINLAFTLAYRSGPSRWMLVQNPPSIPTLAVAKLLCYIRCSRLVVDWHNTGWSILALKLSNNHPFVRIAEGYERLFSHGAYHHFAVSATMCKWLRLELGINATPLRDRPVARFQPLTSDQRLDVLQGIEQTAAYVSDIRSGSSRLIISSTSWTSDEDFSLLLDALVGYSAQAAQDKSLPHLLAIITGKGPGKEHYLGEIARLKQQDKLSNVLILTGWFSFQEYVSLLGASDLGVSLHKSSSGLDLPMKIVDMFGCGLPVVGYCGYPSWTELVKEGVNGHGFLNAQELQALLVSLFAGDGQRLDVLKEGALKERSHGWEEEWKSMAGQRLFFPEMATGEVSGGSR